MRLEHDAAHPEAKGEGLTAAKFGWEPFGKDAKTDCLFLDAMRELAARGMTMLVVTHEMGFAR